MPDKQIRNCTNCEFHNCYYDGYGFDGCTCSKGGLHKWCDEFGYFNDFDPDTQSCDCEYWKFGDGE